MTGEDLLKVENLILYYRSEGSDVRAVDSVSFSVGERTALALVGESGCGKSSTAIALMRLLPPNVSRYEGRILINGLNASSLSEEEFRKRIRWKIMSMVFQGAMNALNPVLKVGFQVAEPLIQHFRYEREEALKAAEKIAREVGLPEGILERYPHELSGGMRQRICIAMALITKPKLVILDEPTSALDIITQANIMNLLKELKWSKGLSYIFITHDISLSSELSDYIAVMYAGKIVEYGPADIVYTSPAHPYVKLLLRSVPRLRRDETPLSIPGAPPDLRNPPRGCRFHPRCPSRIGNLCRVKEPPRIELEREHYVSCWLYEGR